ncbi:hypothetical protein E1B28_013833 [Marasmius oreades]|uniref:MARVEL domain-containing protein n=1 Tax=Marasmius oreades TaxID=181124 RepID=A0A9P7UIQ6_9AGAR|nr:uncharacterized protein E1B28_013833 [Marasmius oreades]KAG7085292.1 hypothetical protein E1B28_013833 [Marasmius oreades]
MIWSIISIARIVVLGIAILFSFVTIALAGHMYSVTGAVIVYDFENLAIAIAVLTIISAPVFLVVGLLRKGSWFTMNVVEVPVLGFLSIIWLANGILYTEWDSILYATLQCNSDRLSAIGQTFCREFKAVEAFSFITWIALFGYAAATIVFCLIGKSRGNNVWLVDASAADYFTWKKNPQRDASFMSQPQYTGTIPTQFTGQTMGTQYTGQQPQMGYVQPVVQPQFQQSQASVQGQTLYPPQHSSSPPVHAQV